MANNSRRSCDKYTQIMLHSDKLTQPRYKNYWHVNKYEKHSVHDIRNNITQRQTEKRNWAGNLPTA